MATFKSADFEIERIEEDFSYEADSGAVYGFLDPKALKPDVLFEMDMQGAEHFLRTILAEDRYEELLEEPEVDGYLLDAIMTAWRKHYGVGVSPGNERGSRKPSDRLAKRSKQTSPTTTQG